MFLMTITRRSGRTREAVKSILKVVIPSSRIICQRHLASATLLHSRTNGYLCHKHLKLKSRILNTEYLQFPPGSHVFKYSTQVKDEKYSLKNEAFKNYLLHIKKEYNSVLQGETSLKDREINRNFSPQSYMYTLTKIEELFKKSDDLKDLQQLLNGLSADDQEMKRLASEELSTCEQQLQELEAQVVDVLTPDLSQDHNDVILEVSAGVGGQEAMLFTDEMLTMYQNYAMLKGWGFQLLSYDKSDMGGIRKATASVTGDDVYKSLKFEAGVHRVQRIPKTEKAGRVHTSTMAVAVLPQPTEIDITLNAKDLKIETCRASGKGGQHVNTTDSAVRILHIPTGIFAECQQERSQIKNKETAMGVLKSRIFQKYLDEQVNQQQQARKFQVGSSGRSEKIRTYNFSQDRITDHRLHHNVYNIERFMTGKEDLDNLLQLLSREARLEILDENLRTFSQ